MAAGDVSVPGFDGASAISAVTAARRAAQNMQNARSACPPIRETVAVATTSTDDVGDTITADIGFTTVQFPEVYADRLHCVLTDMDTNVTPTLVFDLKYQVKGGSAETLKASITEGQAGGEFEVALGCRTLADAKVWFEVTAAAATGAAGTITMTWYTHPYLHTLD